MGALGANGLLFDMDPGVPFIKTEAGYNSTFYHVPSANKTAYGEAIYVIEE